MKVCLIDTSIFNNIINVPGKSNERDRVLDKLEEKVVRGENLLLPYVTIVETGNHIAQNGDGRQRRKCAEIFVQEIKKALMGETPFIPTEYPEINELFTWIDDFPDHAMRGIGFADLSIINEFHKFSRKFSRRTVYIWTLDIDLQGYSS